MNTESIKNEAAKKLYNALAEREPIDAISSTYAGLTVEDAYEIQLINVKRYIGEGEIISGRKIGLTSKPMQELLGISEPDYGHLYQSMNKKDGIVFMKDVIAPKAEGEIAFVLKEDLEGPNVTVEDVYRATDYVMASIEIVDSRIQDWKIKLVDTVADNGSSSCYVLSDKKVKLDDLSLIDIEMTVYKNGEKIDSGKGSDVLGNPAVSVAWLANKLFDYGITLKKGELILSGAITAAPKASENDVFEFEFSQLGSVKVTFK
ncbi:MAG: 2-keto-4-pentenoate hydratase [Sedimentibacter sp.]|uniref:2-keto-4-pentenoate hydratase n=1 Tax=Sedimentibacter sp. TaxID=1960295 RepID=UPI00315935E8